MGYVYVDESIHDRGGFIVLAAIYSPEPLDEAVFSALTKAGFKPGVDEFKSSATMAGNAAAQELRSRLRFLLMERCRVAVAVCAVTERAMLADLTFSLVEQITTSGKAEPGIIYLDGGMKPPMTKPPQGWAASLNSDSREVGGIQLADCAAHIISVMLLSEMGIINKMVEASEHYPEPEVEMAWQLWTSLRYSLSSGEPIGGYDDEGWCEPMMRPFGLLVTDACSAEVKAAVQQRLSAVWVGCIH